MSEIIGKGTWLDKVAAKIVERERRLGRSLLLIRVESGIGASGIPHIGSLSDAVRAYGIKMALEGIGYKSELIAYSDDMDGLRKVPAGLPDWLNEHLAKPVSKVPDPFDCHKSYGEHMSSMLREAFDAVGLKYTHYSGAKAYESGLLDKQIRIILESAELIGRKIAEMVGQKKFEAVLPYYPICETCGRIYLAEVHTYLKDEGKVRYSCKGAEIGRKFIKGCGHEGEVPISARKGKLSWKGEFAARWNVLDIRFEAYGKDIADSVKVNDWISDDVLHFSHPYHIRYEMFLDKGGKKISKSLGNVFTPQRWLKYGTPQSLLLLMFKRVTGTRTLAVEDIPTYMDEYDALEDLYFSKAPPKNPQLERRLRGLYEYVNHLNPPKAPSVHIPYRLLAQLASVAPKDGLVGYVVSRLVSYRAIAKPTPDLKGKIMLAANFAKDFQRVEKTQVELSDKERTILQELVSVLESEQDGEEIQGAIFAIARKHGLEPPVIFRALYRILIGADRGPRLGRYMVDIGREKSVKLIREQLESEWHLKGEP